MRLGGQKEKYTDFYLTLRMPIQKHQLLHRPNETIVLLLGSQDRHCQVQRWDRYVVLLRLATLIFRTLRWNRYNNVLS